MVSSPYLLWPNASCKIHTSTCGSYDGVTDTSGNNMLIATGTCARPARNSSAAAWQTHAQMAVMATVYAQLVDRRLLTASPQEDLAGAKHLSGPASRLQHSGMCISQIGKRASADRRRGCCNEDPCMNNSTCPEGKLEPTYWDRPDQYEYFKDLNILLSSTAPRPTSSASPSSGSSSGGSSNRSAVIGGAVGGTLGFLAIVGLAVFLLWRRKRVACAKDPSVSSMEETKPAGELASPISAGTGKSPRLFFPN